MKHRATKTIQHEIQKGGEESTSVSQDDCKQSNICVTAVPKRGGRPDKIYEDIMAEKLPNLMKTIIPWSQYIF